MTNVPDAHKAVTAAERRSLAVPNDVREKAAIRGAIFQTVQQPAPDRPPLPASAADVERVIREHALELQAHDLTARAASRFREDADLQYVQAVRAAVPAWITGLQKEFTTLVGVVSKAAAKLPQDVALVDSHRLDWNNPTHATAYNKAEGAAAQLEQLINDRADIVKVAGGDGGRDNALFAIAALPAPTLERVMNDDWRDLSPAITQWRELRHKAVARWVYLVRQQELKLSLATPGEVRQRSAQVERWRDAGHARRSGLTLAAGQAAARQYLAETA